MELKTAIGSLIVTAVDDREVPVLTIGFRPDGCENKTTSTITLVEAKVKETNKDVETISVQVANGHVINLVLHKKHIYSP